jgi:hypothetical protein
MASCTKRVGLSAAAAIALGILGSHAVSAMPVNGGLAALASDAPAVEQVRVVRGEPWRSGGIADIATFGLTIGVRGITPTGRITITGPPMAGPGLLDAWTPRRVQGTRGRP